MHGGLRITAVIGGTWHRRRRGARAAARGAISPVVTKRLSSVELHRADGDPGGRVAHAAVLIKVDHRATHGDGADVRAATPQDPRERAAAAKAHREDSFIVDA